MPLVAAAPLHPDGFQPGNAVRCERPLLVGRPLVFQPGPQPDACVGHIPFDKGEIAVPLIIEGSLCIKTLPLGIHAVPNHSQRVQLVDLVLLQTAAAIPAAGVADPVAQCKTCLVFVFGWNLQISVGLSVVLRGLQPTRPGGLGAGLPHHADAVQPLDLLRRQTAVLFPAAADAALGLHPFAEAQPRRRPVTQRYVQITVLRVVNARF